MTPPPQLTRKQPPEGRVKPTSRGGLGLLGGGALTLAISLALLVGLQLGGLPWRMRREFLRLQGALVGGLVGVLVGYAAGRGSSEPPQS